MCVVKQKKHQKNCEKAMKSVSLHAKNIKEGTKNDTQVEVQNKDTSLNFKTQVKLESE